MGASATPEPILEEEKGRDNTVKGKTKKFPVVIPYVKSVSKHPRGVFNQYGVPLFFKPSNTLRQLLVRAKDKIQKEKMVGPVYHIQCDTCEASYVGETETSLKARFSEHGRSSATTSEVSRHINFDRLGHMTDLENTKLLTVVEPKWFEQGVKETIYTRLKDPNLNSDWGRYNPSSVWDILFQTIGTTPPTGSEIIPREPSGNE